MVVDGQSIMITGGTGSFGRAFARELLANHNPRKVCIFSRDEWKQWEMQTSEACFRSDKVRFFLGDVRDGARLRRALQDVDIVVHAAALKQVPAAEYNPCECVKTNVIGAMNLIEAAIDAGVQRVVGLSTDKAVNPVNLYGATKLCADKLLVAGNAYVGKRGYPRFSVVRYGNVLGSRGSVVARWKELAAKGVTSIPVTHREMTRFWLSLEGAVQAVLRALGEMKGGEIFVPKCASMKLVDLAEAIAPGVPLEITGVRPGEKLHEVLISGDEAAHTGGFPGHYVVWPHHAQVSGQLVESEWSYASNTNLHWLSAAELNALGNN